jgi:hypothetical protein
LKKHLVGDTKGLKRRTKKIQLLFEANRHNSMILISDIGTVQGSILGPIVYALFSRPMYDLEKLITFVDNNYMIGYHRKRIWL